MMPAQYSDTHVQVRNLDDHLAAQSQLIKQITEAVRVVGAATGDHLLVMPIRGS